MKKEGAGKIWGNSRPTTRKGKSKIKAKPHNQGLRTRAKVHIAIITI